MEIRPGEYVVISTTCDAQEIADSIAEALLGSGLVACVQAESVDSRYWWEGEIQRQREIKLSAKCGRADCDEVERLILSAHSYEVPEIVMTELIGGGGDYLRWLDAVTRGREDSSRTPPSVRLIP
jgi:periplasmic divalent cation tolerance protein